MLVLLGLVILYAAAIFTLPLIAVNAEVEDPAEVEIYILTNGVHTDIVCPIRNEVMDWSQMLPASHTLSQSTGHNFAAFGWGDKGFYLNTPTWADLKVSVALKAAFWLSESAVHVTYYKALSEDDSCRKVTISKENYRKLVAYILNTFDKKEDSVIHIPTDMVYGVDDAFYEAKGSYNLFFTCNTWANSALKAAGQKAALWTATDKGIFRHYNPSK